MPAPSIGNIDMCVKPAAAAAARRAGMGLVRTSAAQSTRLGAAWAVTALRPAWHLRPAALGGSSEEIEQGRVRQARLFLRKPATGARNHRARQLIRAGAHRHLRALRGTPCATPGLEQGHVLPDGGDMHEATAQRARLLELAGIDLEIGLPNRIRAVRPVPDVPGQPLARPALDEPYGDIGLGAEGALPIRVRGAGMQPIFAAIARRRVAQHSHARWPPCPARRVNQILPGAGLPEAIERSGFAPVPRPPGRAPKPALGRLHRDPAGRCPTMARVSQSTPYAPGSNPSQRRHCRDNPALTRPQGCVRS